MHWRLSLYWLQDLTSHWLMCLFEIILVYVDSIHVSSKWYSRHILSISCFLPEIIHFFFYFFKNFYIVGGLGGGVPAPQGMCGGQRTAGKSQFFSCTHGAGDWTPAVRLGAANTFTLWAISLNPKINQFPMKTLFCCNIPQPESLQRMVFKTYIQILV